MFNFLEVPLVVWFFGVLLLIVGGVTSCFPGYWDHGPSGWAGFVPPWKPRMTGLPRALNIGPEDVSKIRRDKLMPWLSCLWLFVGSKENIRSHSTIGQCGRL